MGSTEDDSMIPLERFILTIIEEREKTQRVRMEALDRALVLNAAEVSRRMDEANHVKNDILEHKADYVSKSGFEPWKDIVSEFMTTSKTQDAAKYRTYTIVMGLITLVFLIIQILVIIFVKVR